VAKLHKEAIAAGHEVTRKDGPVTLRCLPSSCAADFFFEDNEPRQFKAKANVTDRPDYSSTLFQSFVRGMVVPSEEMIEAVVMDRIAIRGLKDRFVRSCFVEPDKGFQLFSYHIHRPATS
jgi:hypothetical protein